MAISTENQRSSAAGVVPAAVPASMTAAVYRGQGDVRVETVPVPKIGPGELLILRKGIVELSRDAQ